MHNSPFLYRHELILPQRVPEQSLYDPHANHDKSLLRQGNNSTVKSRFSNQMIQKFQILQVIPNIIHKSVSMLKSSVIRN